MRIGLTRIVERSLWVFEPERGVAEVVAQETDQTTALRFSANRGQRNCQSY
jgi:hypothetical protein